MPSNTWLMFLGKLWPTSEQHSKRFIMPGVKVHTIISALKKQRQEGCILNRSSQGLHIENLTKNVRRGNKLKKKWKRGEKEEEQQLLLHHVTVIYFCFPPAQFWPFFCFLLLINTCTFYYKVGLKLGTNRTHFSISFH